MADQNDINNTRRQNELLDAQLSTLDALNRLAQQRVVFEGEVSDEIANENDFLRQQLIVRNNLNKGGTRQLTTQKELNKAASQNLGIARSIQNITASELGSQKLIEKVQKDKAKVQGNINFLRKQSLEIDRQQELLLKRFQNLKSLEKKTIEAANKAEAQGDKEKANNLKSRAANLGVQAKSYQAQIENNNSIVDSLDQQVKLGDKLLKELNQVEDVSKAIQNDGFLSIFETLKKIVNIIPGMRELLPGFDQAATAYREALVYSESLTKEQKGIGDKEGQRIEGLSGDQAEDLNKRIKDFRSGAKGAGGKGMTKDFVKSLPKGVQDSLKGTTGTAAMSILSNKFKNGVSAAVSPLTAAFKALQKFLKNFILLQFLSAMLKADKAAGQLAKSMNVSYKEAALMGNQFNSIANTSNSIFVTTKGLQETQMAINKELGTAAMLTDEQLTTMTKLREAAGFTNEELSGIFKISASTGKEMETITGEVLAQAKITSLKNGVVLNEREILKDISKVSAATTLSLGKSTEAIASAVTTAKALGMELSKVDAIAGSILQFETSIEDELSAELLIGKELNLEKARSAALNNDIETLTKEIAANIGSAAEFGEMNRLQQEALAKAVGMNREELAQTLYVQEQLAGISGEEAKNKEKILNARIAEVGLAQTQQEIAEEGFETLENQASVQDQLVALTDKLGEVFASLAPILLPILDTALMILKPISSLIGYIVEGFKAMAPALTPVIAVLGALYLKSKATAIMNIIKGAWNSLGSIPFVGPILAGTAILAGVGYLNSQKADDLMSKPTNNTGYGDRILVTKEGNFAFNNRDTIQASTKGSPNSNTGGGETNVTTKLYIDNQKFAEASTLGFSKL